MEKESIQFEHKPSTNADWTGENTWPSLNLPENEEMQSYFTEKKNYDKVKASKGEPHAVSTSNAMHYFE